MCRPPTSGRLAWLVAAELRLALLGESAAALGKIVGLARQHPLVAIHRRAGPVERASLGVDRLLGHPHRYRRQGGDLGGPLAAARHGLAGRDDFIDHAPGQRLLRRASLTEDRELLGA